MERQWVWLLAIAIICAYPPSDVASAGSLSDQGYVQGEVILVFSQQFMPLEHRVSFDPPRTGIESVDGIYFIMMKAEDFKATKKLALLK